MCVIMDKKFYKNVQKMFCGLYELTYGHTGVRYLNLERWIPLTMDFICIMFIDST